MVGRGAREKSVNKGKGKAVGRCVKDGGFGCFPRDSGGPQNHPEICLFSQPASLPSLHEAYGTSCFWFNQMVLLELGEMSQQLRTPAALAEDLSMIPGIHTRGLTTTAGPGDPMSSSCFPGHRKT